MSFHQDSPSDYILHNYGLISNQETGIRQFIYRHMYAHICTYHLSHVEIHENTIAIRKGNFLFSQDLFAALL
jgi:hypothetical protein